MQAAKTASAVQRCPCCDWPLADHQTHPRDRSGRKDADVLFARYGATVTFEECVIVVDGALNLVEGGKKYAEAVAAQERRQQKSG